MIKRVDRASVKSASRFMLNKTARKTKPAGKMELPSKINAETDMFVKNNNKASGIKKGWGDGNCTNIDPCSPLFP